MKLAIVNASPRGRKSNSDKILSWLLADIEGKEGVSYEKFYVADKQDRKIQMEMLMEAESVVIIFPLYGDAMPGITKEFFECMDSRKKSLGGKSIFFIIHSGFPEAIQSRAAEKYAGYLAKSLGMNHLGTIVMGLSEALSSYPDEMFKKKIIVFRKLGRNIAEGKPINSEDLYLISGPETLSTIDRFIWKLGINSFWNKRIKANKAFGKRYSRPYW